jgi:DNA-directed RNA polymerase subunit omega
MAGIGRIYGQQRAIGKRGLRLLKASFRPVFTSFSPLFFHCLGSGPPLTLFPLWKTQTKIRRLNSELCRKSLEKVGNPNVLVNLISRRVRQLNAGGGGANRPLLENPGTMGVADIAMTELVEEKLGWEMLDDGPTTGKSGRG